MSTWTEKEITEFKKFHEKAKMRFSRGESEESVFRDKPDGYTEWAKEHFKETGGIRLPKEVNIPTAECWNCGKVYQGNKCPFCGAFKPKN